MKNGVLANKWLKKALQPSYYWATVDDQVPVELDQVSGVQRTGERCSNAGVMGGWSMVG